MICHGLADKLSASFADMLAALRRESLDQIRAMILLTGGIPPGVDKILKPLEQL